MFKLDLEKAEGPKIKLSISVWSSKKWESYRRTPTSALLTMPKSCLTQWNYETCCVGPPKTVRSWWRVLTKCGPLEKGIANHFSILALRTPWTVWTIRNCVAFNIILYSSNLKKIFKKSPVRETHARNFWWIVIKNFLSLFIILFFCDFPGGSDDKVSAYNVGVPGSNPGLGRSPGEGKSNPLQHSCLENPMDGGAGRLQSMGSQSQTRLRDFTFFLSFFIILLGFYLTSISVIFFQNVINIIDVTKYNSILSFL